MKSDFRRRCHAIAAEPFSSHRSPVELGFSAHINVLGLLPPVVIRGPRIPVMRTLSHALHVHSSLIRPVLAGRIPYKTFAVAKRRLIVESNAGGELAFDTQIFNY